MARTTTVTENNSETLHYLLKRGENEAALVCAEAMLDEMFDYKAKNYPVAAHYARDYMFIAIAQSRNHLPAEFWLMKMMDCLTPHRASQYIDKYYRFIGDEGSRAHPFFVYWMSLVSSLRYSLRSAIRKM